MLTTTEKKKWPFALGRSVATGLIELLADSVEPGFITSCGSLRRCRPQVGDVEILYVSKIGMIQKPGEMFGGEGSLADNFINGLVGSKLEKRPNVNGGFTWGPLNKLAIHAATGMPVDLFSTMKENWWVSLVIRTGPKEFNIHLIESAKRRGLQLHAYGAFTELGTGNPIYPQSEQEVFEIAGVPWLAPEDRH